MGMGLPLVGESCCRMLMGDDGLPQGVLTSSVAARVKPGSEEIPVPPMTAMWTGAVRRVSGAKKGRGEKNAHHRTCSGHLPSYDIGWRWSEGRGEGGDEEGRHRKALSRDGAFTDTSGVGVSYIFWWWGSSFLQPEP
jgi:hypothetical protein